VKQLGWTLLLIFLIMYMFSIVFTQATTEYLISSGTLWEDTTGTDCRERSIEDFYGTLAKSHYTLFKTICGGIDWEVAAHSLSDAGWPFVVLFQVYVAFMFFAVLNVVIGVFCHSAIENAHKDQDSVVNEQIASKQAYISQLEKLFQDVESENQGAITLFDLERKLADRTMTAWFEVLEIEVTDAWTLFKLLDTHERNAIDIGDFVEGCLRLKGSARSLDMARMMYENRWMMNKLVRMSEDVNDIREGISKLNNPLMPHSALAKSERELVQKSNVTFFGLPRPQRDSVGKVA